MYNVHPGEFSGQRLSACLLSGMGWNIDFLRRRFTGRLFVRVFKEAYLVGNWKNRLFLGLLAVQLS
jgi:hypothetical protein